jgi:archaeosine synthase
LVPRELEDVYPAAHYDVPVTGVWSPEEKEISINLLKEYLRKTESPVIGHVKGEYEEICVECGVKTTSGQIGELERSVSESLKGKKVTPHLNERLRRVSAVCDFQFGTTAQEHLFKERIFLKGFQIYGEKQGLLATIDRASGCFSHMESTLLSSLSSQRLTAFSVWELTELILRSGQRMKLWSHLKISWLVWARLC